MFFKNNQDNNDTKKGHSPFKFLGMMGICCFLPILIVGLIPLLQIKNVGTNIFLTGLSSLICPIMMVVMMVVMMRGGKKKSCCSKPEEVEDTTNINN
jgi:hypothetical protein